MGAITVVTDPTTPDTCCFATIVAGQRYILLHPNFFSLPAATQSLFLGHEHGHHYLQHETTPTQGFSKEYSADAYGIRVLASTEGLSVAQLAISILATLNSPGDATHPSSSQRAAYMTSVLSAMQSNPSNVPAPPTSPPATQTGVLVVLNPTSEPGAVYINLSYLGVLAPGQYASVTLPAGTYRIDLQGQISGLFYNPVFVSLNAGQTVTVP